MMQTNDAELQPTLERATRTLRTAIGEACGADLEHATTGEFIRIEEVLAIANEAAKEVVSVRRRLQTPTATSAPEPGSSREVEDSRGTRWLVFAVHPSSRGGKSSVRDQFRDGWLSFDSGVETRRLAPIPANWYELPDEALCALCDSATVPARRRLEDRRAPDR